MSRFNSSLAGVLSLILTAVAAFARQPESPLPSDPHELVRQTIQNEIRAANDHSERFLFRSTKTTAKWSITKIYVETSEGTASLVVAYNGKPLTPEQRKAEEARVRRFLNDPEELRKKRNQENEDSDRTMRIVRAIPDAFLFEYAGEEQATPGVGHPGHLLVKLTFSPNPRYQPPSRVEQVLTGMQGFLLVDPQKARLAVIDGTLFREVSFGWGILGHLDRGGHFLVQQEQIEGGSWTISRMNLNFTGKILLFKNLVIQSNEVFSGFRRVPSDLTFAQALDLLQREESAPQENPTESRASQ